MKSPIPYTYDLNTKSAQKVICVTHTDDNSVDVIQLHVVQNGALIDFSGNTIIARMVMSRTHELLSDNVVCEIDEATKDVMIPIDRKAVSTRKGLMLVEVSVRGVLPQKLTFQFPLLVRVNGSILDDAEITPESQGTIPELLIAAAEELRRVQGFITSDDVYDILDSALQGAQNVAPSLYVKRKGDNYVLVYEDSEDVLHELFDFSNLPSGTSDYTDLENKPQINGNTLSGNKTSDELGLQNKLTAGENVNIDANGNITITGVTKYRNVTTEQVDDCIENGVLYSLYISGLQSNAQIIAHNNYTTITQHALLDDGRLMYRMRQGETPWQPAGEWSAWESIGGSQIVSGVVNQNGTITFTDSDGNTFTTTGSSVIGADGFSPVATVTQTASGATVSITDKNGTTTANISNGQDYVLTAQDKSDIADIVLSELPNADTMSF